MELDFDDWLFCLEMLSVEDCYPYCDELQLPFERSQHASLIRLTRACHEVYFYPFALAEDDSWGFFTAWKKYRDSLGVLNDATLKAFSLRCTLQKMGRNYESITETVFDELLDSTGENFSSALKDWFHAWFRPRPDPLWKWPWLACIFMNELMTEPDAPVVVLASEHAISVIQGFCKKYSVLKKEMDLRFYNIYLEAKSSPPSIWESVLQHFPEGGLGNDKSWFGYIEHSLRYRMDLTEWRQLSQDLGKDIMSELIPWLREKSLSLEHWGGIVPEPPQI